MSGQVISPGEAGQYTAAMDRTNQAIDVAIIGGGAAGLWLLDRLHSAGYSSALFASGPLGGEQTLAAQGMIHGGMKYALDGSAGADAQAVAAMPGVWRECLAGHGAVDLRGCDILSDRLHLWSSGALPTRLATLLAGRLLQGTSRRIDSQQGPGVFQHPGFRGALVELSDFVIDPASLIRLLAERHRERLFAIDWRHATLQVRDRRAQLQLPGLTLEPGCLVLAAGAGNAGLLGQLGQAAPAMQTRPLAQVLVRSRDAQPLFGHCIGTRPSPRLTVSTHLRANSDRVWYLGGDLATKGVEMTDAELVQLARAELAATLPWVNLGDADWRVTRVDRAEPAQPGGGKPDGAYLGRIGNIDNTLVAWPTKLTLCPQLGDALIESLATAQGQAPSAATDYPDLTCLGRPEIGQPPWETAFQ